jgi:hypothetical protein
VLVERRVLACCFGAVGEDGGCKLRGHDQLSTCCILLFVLSILLCDLVSREGLYTCRHAVHVNDWSIAEMMARLSFVL